ncbi:MAG: peptidoglycan DD-metalloendopeptidase family protein [Nitriliruptor sp.]
MRRPPRWVLLTLLVAVCAPTTAVAQDLEAELEQAEERAEELRGDLDAATAAYEDTWARIEQLRAERSELEGRAEELEAQYRRAQAAMTDRAVAMFKRGRTDASLFLLAAEGPGEAADRAALLSALQTRDRAEAERAGALSTALDQIERLLVERTAELDRLQEELDAQRDELAGDLQDAEARADDLEQRAQNRRRIERGAQQGVYSCIFAPGRTNFRDTWGAPRSGGRSHKGTDVFAVMGEPVLAFTDGTIARHSNGGLGGISVYLQGDDANLYYYTHLQRIDANGAVGRRVQGGEVIAYNGDTGNARGGAPHVHFELKPGGGASINPYPWLAAACF